MAGIGTVMLLPNRSEGAIRRIGGVLLLTALLIGAARVADAARNFVHLYFWIFSAIALISSVRVITHPRPVYSALYFILTVFASAGLFVLLWAEFMAAALILIYAGAILITYVFVIMLASQASSGVTPARAVAEYDNRSREPVIAATVGFALMGLLLYVIYDKATVLARVPESVSAPALYGGTPPPFNEGTAESLGRNLFHSQVVNLELAGLILTIAMVGAIVIARRRVISRDSALAPASMIVVAGSTPVDDDPHSIPVYGTENPRQKAYPES